MTASQKKQIDKIQKYVTTDLALSDKVINGDLLRFYKLPGFTKVNKSSYTYNAQKSFANLKKVRRKKEDESAGGKHLEVVCSMITRPTHQKLPTGLLKFPKTKSEVRNPQPDLK
ncbi:hypothetical protein ACW2AB_02270 [Limosilactobacillus fermentum]